MAELSSKNFAAVTPSDSTTFDMCLGLYVGVSGDVAVANGAGTSVVFVGVPSGTILPIRTTKVFATGTTASSIVRV